MADKLYKMQKFPIYYPGAGEFQDADGNPSGAAGSEATVEIGLNNRPHEIVGVRIVNVYERVVPVPEIDTGDVELPQNVETCCLLGDLDDDQTVQIDLAQQNVIVRAIHQRTLCGKQGIHWHPFPCSYPFRGGNNMFVRLRRLTSYPAAVLPKVRVTVIGWMYVSDELPPGSPPSTDFDNPPQGATGWR